MAASTAPTTCPVGAGRDDRKSAGLAAARAKPVPGTTTVRSFGLGRDILRSPAMKQAGMGAEQVVIDDPSHAPVFFLDGEEHKRKRIALARFFTPKAIDTRHAAVMEVTTDELLAELRAKGSGDLDRMAWTLAVIVAGTIVGLTDDKARIPAMANRIEGVLILTRLFRMKPVARLFGTILGRVRVMHFLFRDVRPAIKARRATPREDIISHLVAEGYSEPAILIECMTYATAGMATTREFISMVAWHLFENAALRQDRKSVV